MTNEERYVNLAELKKKVRYCAKSRGMNDSALQNLLNTINSLPVTLKGELETTLDEGEAKPVGEWEYADKVAGMRYYHCTNCTSGYETLADENEVTWWRFCPRCGAKMFTKDGNTLNEKPQDNFCKDHGCSLETRQSCCGCKDYFDDKQRRKKND